MSVINDGDQHLAAAIEVEGLLNQLAFALKRTAFEFDAKGFAKNLDGTLVQER